MTTFQKGDLVRRNDTIALVTGPADEREGLPLLVEGKRIVSYAPQWTLFRSAAPKKSKGGRPPGSRNKNPRPSLTSVSGLFRVQRADEDGGWINPVNGHGVGYGYTRFYNAWNNLLRFAAEYPGVAFRIVNEAGGEVTVPLAVMRKREMVEQSAAPATCPCCGALLNAPPAK